MPVLVHERQNPRSPPLTRETDVERRERIFQLAMLRGRRCEPIEETIARAETIRNYIESGKQ